MFSNFNFRATEKQKERSNDVGEKWRSPKPLRQLTCTLQSCLNVSSLSSCDIVFFSSTVDCGDS